MFVTESQLNANLQVVQVVVIQGTCKFRIACGLLVLPDLRKQAVVVASGVSHATGAGYDCQVLLERQAERLHQGPGHPQAWAA